MLGCLACVKPARRSTYAYLDSPGFWFSLSFARRLCMLHYISALVRFASHPMPCLPVYLLPKLVCCGRAIPALLILFFLKFSSAYFPHTFPLRMFTWHISDTKKDKLPSILPWNFTSMNRFLFSLVRFLPCYTIVWHDHYCDCYTHVLRNICILFLYLLRLFLLFACPDRRRRYWLFCSFLCLVSSFCKIHRCLLCL